MDKIKQFFLGNRELAYSDKLPNQLLLTCRTLVGGYLFYLAYELKDSVKNGDEKMRVILIVAIVVFAVFGALFLYDSLRNLIIGRYVGGKLDLGERPENYLDGKTDEDFDDVVTEDEAIEEYAAENAKEHDRKEQD